MQAQPPRPTPRHRPTTTSWFRPIARRKHISPRFARHLKFASAYSYKRLTSRSATPEQAFEQNHLGDDVQKALDALPPQFRAAVVLCDIEGLSYEEVADVLDIKLGTVRSRIHRGRAQLREALAHRAPAQVTRTTPKRRPSLRPAAGLV